MRKKKYKDLETVSILVFLTSAFILMINFFTCWIVGSISSNLPDKRSGLKPPASPPNILAIKFSGDASPLPVISKGAGIPFWAHLDPFGPFQTKMIFLPQMDKVGVGRGASEQNINSCLKHSKRVQMGPKGFLMAKNTNSWPPKQAVFRVVFRRNQFFRPNVPLSPIAVTFEKLILKGLHVQFPYLQML